MRYIMDGTTDNGAPREVIVDAGERGTVASQARPRSRGARAPRNGRLPAFPRRSASHPWFVPPPRENASSRGRRTETTWWAQPLFSASTTHTGPGANRIGSPSGVVNSVPSSSPDRSHSAGNACPSRSTVASPEPTVSV